MSHERAGCISRDLPGEWEKERRGHHGATQEALLLFGSAVGSRTFYWLGLISALCTDSTLCTHFYRRPDKPYIITTMVDDDTIILLFRQ